MKKEYYILPSLWASPLINGDYSGLDDIDVKFLTDFLYVNCPGNAIDCEPVGFRHRHDAYKFHIGGTDCHQFTFKVTA